MGLRLEALAVSLCDSTDMLAFSKRKGASDHHKSPACRRLFLCSKAASRPMRTRTLRRMRYGSNGSAWGLKKQSAKPYRAALSLGGAREDPITPSTFFLCLSLRLGGDLGVLGLTRKCELTLLSCRGYQGK